MEKYILFMKTFNIAGLERDTTCWNNFSTRKSSFAKKTIPRFRTVDQKQISSPARFRRLQMGI